MIVTCEQCWARFRLADEKLKPGGTKVRCSKCRNIFTVFPPESAPAEEAVDFGDFNMERVSDEEPAQPAAPAVPAAAEPAPAPPAGGGELDFSGLEASLGPDSGPGEVAEEFSFADTAAPAEPAPPATAGGETFAAAFDETGPTAGTTPGELDFDATFAESEDAPSGTPADGSEFSFAAEPAAGPDTFSFDEVTTEQSSAFAVEADEAPAPDRFSFDSEPATGGEFDFDTEPPAPGPAPFNFGEEATEPSFDFNAEAGEAPATDRFSFEQEKGGTAFDFGSEPALTDDAAAWEQRDQTEAPSFDFDEPSFETRAEEPPAKSKDEAGLSFGEIDFSSEGSQGGGAGGPDFTQATLARPSQPEPPLAEPAEPPPRPTPSRPRGEEALPAMALPRKSPMSRALVGLALLLTVLCGAGGYFYFMADGEQVVDRLLLKLKGEEPAAPVEQRIGLSISGSSYVENREAGQLLVIQGSATNNFAGARSAITVKGLLIDAGGKVLQQQTVFCGNFLSEEKLATLRYAQIEEAMNNQFGDSLSNMNLKPGASIRFTIVFRNPPKELANINVEIVDSKPGGI